MVKTLHHLPKSELISIIQDYQELVSEIEHIIMTNSGTKERATLSDGLLAVREALFRYVYKDHLEEAS